VKQITQYDIARHCDCTQSVISRMFIDGKLPAPKNGVYDLDACRVAYIRILRAAAGSNHESLATERTRLARIQADDLEFTLASRRRQFLPRAEIVSAIQSMVADARAKLLSLPTRLATELAAMTKPARVMDLLTDRINECLAELARTEAIAEIETQGVASDSGRGQRMPKGLDAAAASNGKSMGGPRKATKSRGVVGAG
jgi:phage terminase Nu1 subunit (DNA packaging protein)